MSKHTPGPWRLKSDPAHFDSLTTIEGGAVGVRKPFGVQMIVQVGGDADHIEAEANARLIAAAPDLLEALQVMFRDYSAVHASCGDLEMSPALFQAQRAIARATGESE